MQEFWYLLKGRLLIYAVSFALALPAVLVGQWLERKVINPVWPMTYPNAGMRELAVTATVVGILFLIGRHFYLKFNNKDKT